MIFGEVERQRRGLCTCFVGWRFARALGSSCSPTALLYLPPLVAGLNFIHLVHDLCFSNFYDRENPTGWSCLGFTSLQSTYYETASRHIMEEQLKRKLKWLADLEEPLHCYWKSGDRRHLGANDRALMRTAKELSSSKLLDSRCNSVEVHHE